MRVGVAAANDSSINFDSERLRVAAAVTTPYWCPKLEPAQGLEASLSACATLIHKAYEDELSPTRDRSDGWELTGRGGALRSRCALSRRLCQPCSGQAMPRAPKGPPLPMLEHRGTQAGLTVGTFQVLPPVAASTRFSVPSLLQRPFDTLDLNATTSNRPGHRPRHPQRQDLSPIPSRCISRLVVSPVASRLIPEHRSQLNSPRNSSIRGLSSYCLVSNSTISP